MNFGIIFAENKKFNNLEIDPWFAFKRLLLLLLFVILLLIVFGEYIGYKNIDSGINIFLFISPFILMALFNKSEVIFDADKIMFQSLFGVFKKEFQIGEVKSLTLDEFRQFHLILNNDKEFIFRARRRSEHEDLRNQFYSVGLYKEDIRK